MTVFDILSLIGGLCLFLFGMNIMGLALERRAGSRLQSLLGKLTTGKFAGVLTGIGITSIIQSSSATTVMVVGFVNSGLMTLKQAINVIMGANVGTTVTAWVLSLAGISSDNIFVQLLKPSSFTPVLALIGIIFYMFCKNDKKKDTGVILLGFSVLMFGMEAMTSSVSGLADIPAFTKLFVMFRNPLPGVIAGALLTAVIQSSSASVGILQALAMTGAVSYSAAIPIIMGQNIGTCVTAVVSSLGTARNAKRAAFVHLSFNIIGTTVWLTVFYAVNKIFSPAVFSEAATLTGIAAAHSAFNILCTLLLLPMSSLLEKLAYKFVPEAKSPEALAELDERLLSTPTVALEQSRRLAVEMAYSTVRALKDSLVCLFDYSQELADSVRSAEEKADHCEDIIGTYLVKLSINRKSGHDSTEAATLLKIIGDVERISDHAVNFIESAEEIRDKEMTFSDDARDELKNIIKAVNEVVDRSYNAFVHNDTESAYTVEPLEEIIDNLSKELRDSHIKRLQNGTCSIETGFVWADILTNLERTSDHCSNIAGCIIDAQTDNLNIHESLKAIRDTDPDFREQYSDLKKKYL